MIAFSLSLLRQHVTSSEGIRDICIAVPFSFSFSLSPFDQNRPIQGGQIEVFLSLSLFLWLIFLQEQLDLECERKRKKHNFSLTFFLLSRRSDWLSCIKDISSCIKKKKKKLVSHFSFGGGGKIGIFFFYLRECHCSLISQRILGRKERNRGFFFFCGKVSNFSLTGHTSLLYEKAKKSHQVASFFFFGSSPKNALGKEKKSFGHVVICRPSISHIPSSP